MAELFVPKALDLLGPALQIADLRQKQTEFKALQDYRNQANQQNQAQNVQAKLQSLLSLAGTQPDQAAALFNSDPNLIQMNKGNPVKFIGKSEGYNQFQVDDSGRVSGISPEGKVKDFGIIGKSQKPTADKEDHYTIRNPKTGETKSIRLTSDQSIPSGWEIAYPPQQPSNIFLGFNEQGKPMFAPTKGAPNITIGNAPEGGPSVGKTMEALPLAAQDNLSQGLGGLKTLDKLDDLLEGATQEMPVLSFITGKGKELGVKLGFSGDASQYQAWKNQFKLQAQSLIKGTPSNFDVMTVIDTIPSLSDSTSVARQKLAVARNLLRTEISNQIAYYKGTNKIMPGNIIKMARTLGVEIGSVSPDENPWEQGPGQEQGQGKSKFIILEVK